MKTSSNFSPIQKVVAALPFLLIFFIVFFDLSTTFQIPRNVLLTLIMMLWMVSWWIFEILPMGITALIPIFFLPVFDLMPISQVTPFYGSHIIFLFLGGFIIARAIEKTRLNERIALFILKITGRSDRGIVVGFTIATAFLSMWISNTATTVMMVPIALSVLTFIKSNSVHDSKIDKELKTMAIVMFLSIAYSANIGGIMTPIGTPPNVVLLGFLNEIYKMEIDFFTWLLIVAPVAITLLFLQFFLLNRVFPYTVAIDGDFRQFVADKLKALGKMDSPQKVTLTIFSLVATLWVFKGLLHKFVGFSFLNDISIAIFGGFSLFLIPAKKDPSKIPTVGKKSAPVLQTKDIALLPWNIILLFGGGMALANALKNAEIIQMATNVMATANLGSGFFLVLALATLTLILTEVMSNVALCLVALPVIMNLAVQNGMHPLVAGLPAALCSSLAFSLPVSTPPNAIVFGTNYIRVKDMLKAGVLLNLIGISVVMSVGWLLISHFI